MFRKLYANTYFRLPLKIFFAVGTTKIFFDLVWYGIQGTRFGLARTMQIYSGQNPINPPIPKPYPYPDTYQHLQDIKNFNDYQRRTFQSFVRNVPSIQHLYVDHPCRQNPDSIDHFIEYGNIYRIQQYINYMFINKLKSQGIQIPEGINQRIRELQQFKLDKHRPVVPQL